MSYLVYVLYSPSYKRYYKGHCENIKERIKEHNSGKTKSTKALIPWKLVYQEEFITREDAITREHYFKTAAGKLIKRRKLA